MHTAKKNIRGEVWKSPPSLGKWWVEVSNLGRVRTLPHKINCVIRGRNIERIEPGRIRKLVKDTRGRYMMFFRKAGHSYGLLIHRLVAECFVMNPNPKRYNYVFFKNGNIADCRATNLQWGDMRDKGYLAQGQCAKHIIKVYDNGECTGEYFGIGEVAEVLDCTKQAVHSAIKRGGFCKGFFLKYENRRDRGSPPKTIEEGRCRRSRVFEFVKIPECVFSEHDIDICPKGVFS